MANSVPTTNQVGVINPYQNMKAISHRKFISHLGIAFIDLRTEEKIFMRQPRTVLRKTSGQFNYGTLNAVMGPWKSGKTTLLKSLAGRNNENIDYESLFYINQDVPPKVAYLDKEVGNNLLLSMTLEETLDFAFRFRNPTVNSIERRLVNKDLIKNFEMLEVKEMELRFCSNEERIKAQVAMCLATVDRPNLIFVDEPLHDIDAVGIETLVKLMKRLCRLYSISIIFSVGQVLDSDILINFDKLYVLSRGGLCIYEGSVEHLSLFLRESDVTINSKIQTPMERLMKIASKPNQVTARLAKQTLTTRDDILHLAQKYGVIAYNGIETAKAPIDIRNIFDLFSRAFLHKYRYRWKSILIYFTILLLFTLSLTSAFSDDIGVPNSCYNRMTNHTVSRFIILADRSSVDQQVLKQVSEKNIDIIEGQQLIDENIKFIFVVCVELALFHLVTSNSGMNDEVKVVINEHRNGWLNITSFFIVKNFIDLVVPLINVFGCSLVAYFLTKQVLDERRFFSFCYAQIVGAICAQSLGFTIGIVSVFNNRFTSIIMLCTYLILLIFSGFLIPLVEAHRFFQVISYLSFLRESFELSLLSLYGMHRCREMGYTNSYVLDEYGIDYDQAYWRNSVIIFSQIIFYRLLFWLILVNKVNKQATINRPEFVNDENDIDDEQEISKNK